MGASHPGGVVAFARADQTLGGATQRQVIQRLPRWRDGLRAGPAALRGLQDG
jgi:hypothetical protein